MSDNRKRPQEEYPPFWEKFVPIALLVIAAFILVLLVVTALVALGLFPGA